MKTLNRAKKGAVLALLLAIFAVPSASSAITNAELNTQLETLKQQLIELLLAQIAELQAQITQLTKQQAPVAQVVEAPKVSPQVLGSALSASFGTPYCNPNSNGEEARIPITISGGWEYGLVTGVEFTRSSGVVTEARLPNNSGTTTIHLELGNSKRRWNSNSPITEKVISQEVVVGNVCQQ